MNYKRVTIIMAVVVGFLVLANVGAWFYWSTIDSPNSFMSFLEPTDNQVNNDSFDGTITIVPQAEAVAVGDPLQADVQMFSSLQNLNTLQIKARIPMPEEPVFSLDNADFILKDSLIQAGWSETLNDVFYDEENNQVIATLSMINLQPEGSTILPTDIIATLYLPTNAPHSGEIIIEQQDSYASNVSGEQITLQGLAVKYQVLEELPESL